jgi:hypothetical protein
MSSKLNSSKTFISFSIAFILLAETFGQDIEKPAVRDIEVKSADSIVKAQIVITKKYSELNAGISYYWYSEGQIHVNQSGIHGFPLHGQYNVFDRKGNLITSGEFLNGVKNGKWQYWHNNGNLKFTEYYKNGIKSGNVERYDINGNIVKEKKTGPKWFQFKKDKQENNKNKQDSIDSKQSSHKVSASDKTDTISSDTLKKSNKRRKKLF